jgi:hypothetical protein
MILGPVPDHIANGRRLNLNENVQAGMEEIRRVELAWDLTEYVVTERDPDREPWFYDNAVKRNLADRLERVLKDHAEMAPFLYITQG